MTPSDLLTRQPSPAAAGHGWAGRLQAIERPARLAVQTATAALATFGLFKLAGLPQASWAVISALFVVQPNVGGTISSALGRIAGTVLGTAVGLGCVLTLGGSASTLALGLLLATASLGFVTGFHPGLRYGLVPAAFILLAPGGEVVEKAWHGAAAIGIGAVVGALSGLLVFPEPAHRAVERHLGEALGRCGDLLGSAVRSLLGEGPPGQVAAAADAIEGELWSAGGVAAQSRYPSRLRRRPAHPRPRELLRAVERLWHSLLVLARAEGAPLPAAARAELAPALAAFAASGSDYLKSLGHALTSNAVPPPAPAGERVRALEDALDRLRQGGATRPIASREAERIFTLAFAIQELSRDFAEVARLFSGPGGENGQG